MTATSRLPVVWGIDPRALAAFRVALGLVVVGDVLSRAGDLAAHYTDAGVLPRSVGSLHSMHGLHLSANNLSGSLWFQALLFVLLGLGAILLTLGLFTRWATFGTWILFVSMIARNEVINQGSDSVVKLLLFWGMFLPLGCRWSVDLRRAGGTPRVGMVHGIAPLALQLQVAFVFFFAGLMKLGDPAWTADGSAVARALNWAPLATPLAGTLSALPHGLLQWASGAMLLLEVLVPIVLFVPIRSPWPRGVGVVALGVTVLAFHLCFRLGSWPYTGYAAALIFVPTVVWDRLAPEPDTGRLPRWEPCYPWQRWLATALIIYVTLFNLDTVVRSAQLPKWVRAPAHLLSIDQAWIMFSPAPRSLGGWYVVTGVDDVDAQMFPIPEAGPSDFKTGHWPSDVYGSHRWRLFMWQWSAGMNERGSGLLLQYACRRHPALRQATLHFQAAVGELDGTRAPPQLRQVASVVCP